MKANVRLRMGLFNSPPSSDTTSSPQRHQSDFLYQMIGMDSCIFRQSCKRADLIVKFVT